MFKNFCPITFTVNEQVSLELALGLYKVVLAKQEIVIRVTPSHAEASRLSGLNHASVVRIAKQRARTFVAGALGIDVRLVVPTDYVGAATVTVWISEEVELPEWLEDGWPCPR